MLRKAKKVESTKNQVPADPPAQNLDGKTQPIGQYKLTSKKPSKNTEEIKQGWCNSITIAHQMLVEVNQELAKILEELDEISEALDKLNEKSMLSDVVEKVNNVKQFMNEASGAANRLAFDFNRFVPAPLRFAADGIAKLTENDFKKLEKGIGHEKVKKLKEIFYRIILLGQNINYDSQDIRQAAGGAKRKKAVQPFNQSLSSKGREDGSESAVVGGPSDSDDDDDSSSYLSSSNGGGIGSVSSNNDENKKQINQPVKKKTLVALSYPSGAAVYKEEKKP